MPCGRPAPPPPRPCSSSCSPCTNSSSASAWPSFGSSLRRCSTKATAPRVAATSKSISSCPTRPPTGCRARAPRRCCRPRVMRRPLSGNSAGKRGLQLLQRAQDLARRDVGRPQLVGGAQQHHVPKGEAVARCAGRATASRSRSRSVRRPRCGPARASPRCGAGCRGSAAACGGSLAHARTVAASAGVAAVAFGRPLARPCGVASTPCGVTAAASRRAAFAGLPRPLPCRCPGWHAASR